MMRIKPTGPFHPRQPKDAEVIRQGIEDGRKVIEIADDLGTTRASVYRAAAKAGLPVCRGRVQHPQTLRRAVEDMRPAQALEYVLEAYEGLTGQDEPIQRIIGGAALTAQQAAIFALLRRYMGEAVSHDLIMSVLCAGSRDATPSDGSLKVQIHNVRRKLAGQYAITPVHGYGYRMEPA